ncbi:unnamed protein product [Rotaria sp. Silwood1]|nr:unnamed protein product [Rotaria sp. Silwood1]CAF5010245.1 unnamed protein product [Rotaria sp. Silwood1]
MFLHTILLVLDLKNDAEKCARKLHRIELSPGQEMIVCEKVINICAQKQSYDLFFGLLSQHLCSSKREYVKCFEKAFKDQYDLAHHLDNMKLKNISKLFSHLLLTNSISWRVYIRLFLISTKLNKCLTDRTLREYFPGIFPRDNPINRKFSIDFFASIGLHGLTNELQEEEDDDDDDDENENRIKDLRHESRMQEDNKQEK